MPTRPADLRLWLGEISATVPFIRRSERTDGLPRVCELLEVAMCALDCAGAFG
jgi:hypothetical protein